MIRFKPIGHWALLAALLFGTAEHSIATKPNIIFILADDLGWGDLGVFHQNSITGSRKFTTPMLDSFAAEGIQMRKHYCPAPVCAPSRASLLLGVHQGHANVRDNQFDKALENNHTLATVLKQAGYGTAIIGKWGLQGSGGNPTAWPAYPTRRGFDYFYGYVRHGDGHSHYPFHTTYDPDGSGRQVRPPKEVWDQNTMVRDTLENCYTTDLFTARAKKWIADHRQSHPAQPFFLYLAYDTPHAALQVPTMAYPPGSGTNGGLQWLGAAGQMINTAAGTIDTYIHPDYTNQHWTDVEKRFATMVRRMDDAVGDLVQTLKDLGVDDNTLIVFSSDNGPHHESYFNANYEANSFTSFGPFDGTKRDLWEGGVREPTLARWPGRIPAGRISNDASQFHDWLSTFAEMAGVPPPARTDGVSLLPTLTGVGAQRPTTTYVEYVHQGSTRSYAEFDPSHRGRARNQMQLIHLGGYKGVRYNIASHTNDFEIYNVDADPKETNNLALNPAFAALQQNMKNRVLQLRRPDTDAPRPYDAEFVPASTNVAFTNGVVAYSAYEGAWPWVPDFASLTAVNTGHCAGLDLSVRSRDQDFGIAFSGFITVPADGDYTFYLTSDSGAHLRIHDATVLDDDFNHTGAEVSGTIRLRSGRHPFRLYYRHGSGPRTLSLKYSGPCISKAPVPLSAFSLAGAADSRPRAVNDCARTPQNTAALIPVLANDTDDGLPEPLRIVSITAPSAGTAVTNGNQILYTPETGFLGDDTFSYTISDGANTGSAMVTVNVFFSTNHVWFPFNQTSGHETIDAGGGIAAALNGFPTESAHWVAGRWNRALQFNGSSQFAAIGSGYLPPAGTSARTTAAWIKTTGAGAIIAWGPNSTSRKWHMRLESGATATGALRVEIGGGFVRGTRDLRDSLWHHVAGVLPVVAAPNATNILLYVDGTLEPLSEATSSPINTDAVAATIGVDSQNRYFPGAIDEARIYQRALSASEIAALYAAPWQSAAAWHHRYFGEAAIDWNADEDGDGGARLLEYALGSQPHIADDQRMKVSAAVLNDRLHVTFPRRLTGTSELQYTVQLSTNLANWTSLPATPASTTASDLPGFEHVTFRAGPAVFEQSPLFMRLRVTLE